MSLNAVAKILKLDASAAYRRIKACIKAGYLVNEETKRGQKMKLRLGDPLPDDGSVLPHPDCLGDYCSIACNAEGVGTDLTEILYQSK